METHAYFGISRVLRLLKALLLVATTTTSVLLLSSCGSTPHSNPAGANKPTHEKHLKQEHQEEYGRALNAIDSDTPQKAISLLKSLADEYPHNLDIRINLAVAYYKNGKLDNALQQAQRALTIDSHIADAYNIVGLISAQRNAYQEAEAAYLKALELMPDHALVHYNIALMYDIYFQKIDKAIEHYQHYLAAFPDDQHTKLWVDQLKRTLSEG